MAAAGSSNVKRVYVKDYLYNPLPTDYTESFDCIEDDSDISDDDSWDQISLSESSEEEEIIQQNRCTCGSCPVHSLEGGEGKCCLSFSKVRSRLQHMDIKCITEHPGFRDNCLSIHVLELAVFEYSRKGGHLGDREHLNEVYRDVSDQRFKTWIFRRQGSNACSIVTPSCVINKIKSRFPKEEKADFKYPRP